MKKRRIALLAALAMMAGTLGAQMSVSAEASAEKEPIEMSVFWWGSQLRNERTQQILDMYAEEHPYITFDGQFSDDYWTRMATLAAGHTLPDVVQMVYAYLDQYATEGTLVDLTPYI